MNRSRNSSRLSLILIGVIAVALLALEFASYLPNVDTPLESLELSGRDTLMRLRGVQPTSGNIVIVAIDDQSFQWTKYEWPWPRAYLAQIVDAINQGGARVVGVDIF